MSDSLTGAGTTSHSLYTTTDTDWVLRDGDIDGYDASAGPFGSSYYVTTTKSGGTWYIYQIVPVVAGEYYSLSGRSGNLRATSVTMSIDWLDSSGSVVSSEVSDINTGSYTGGPGLTAVSPGTGWMLHAIEGVTPPDTAVSAKVICSVEAPYTSGSDLEGFFDQVMFTNTQLAVPYQPKEVADLRAADGNVIIDSSGVTIINGKLTLENSGNVVTIDASSGLMGWLAKVDVTASLSTTGGLGTANSGALTGLGTFSKTPGFLAVHSSASSPGFTDTKSPNPHVVIRESGEAGEYRNWVAEDSGGAVTYAALILDNFSQCYIIGDGSGYINVYVDMYRATGSGTTYASYSCYIMRETTF